MSEGQAHAEHYPGPPHRPPVHIEGPARAHTHAHHPKLQHHFDTMAQQAEASTLGMWVFLVTEIMFFGGLFMAYLVYRYASPEGFQEASHHLNVTWGAINTVVLIVSSLTMALGGARGADQRAAEDAGLLDRRDDVLGAAFLGDQGDRVHRQVHASHRARPALPVGGPAPGGGEMFYSLYFCMTGLHALHMVIGLGIMTVIGDHGVAAAVRRRLLHAGRSRRAVLALRRHRLDFPVPAAVPDRAAHHHGVRLA